MQNLPKPALSWLVVSERAVSSKPSQLNSQAGLLCYWRQPSNYHWSRDLFSEAPVSRCCVCGWCGTDSRVSGTQHPAPLHTPLLLCAAVCTVSHSKTVPGRPQSRKEVQCNGVATWQAAAQCRAKLVLVMSLPESASRAAGQLSSRRPCTCPWDNAGIQERTAVTQSNYFIWVFSPCRAYGCYSLSLVLCQTWALLGRWSQGAVLIPCLLRRTWAATFPSYWLLSP